MGRTVTAALVCLLAAGVVVAGGVGGSGGGQPAAGSGDAAAANGERDATVESEQVSVDNEGSGLDVGVSMEWGGVSLETDGDGSGEGEITHDAIDDGMADAGSAGACAVGFGEDGSPLDFAFDGGNGSFGLTWSGNASDGESSGGSVDAGEVVEECSSATE